MRWMQRRSIGRTVFLAGVLAGTAWGSSALPPLLDGRLRLPVDPTGDRVRDVLLRADKAGAATYLPGKRVQAETQLTFALKEVNAQRGRPFYDRDFTRGERLLDEASRAALALHAEAASRSRRDREEATRLIGELESQLVGARAFAAHANGDAYVRQRLALAEIRLKDARALLAAGRCASAARSAREGLSAARVSAEKSRGLLSRFSDPANLSRWTAWVREAVQESRSAGVAVVVIKELHRLDVYRAGARVRSIPVDLGANSLRQKMHAGDRTTPEGRYRITQKKNFGQSKFGQALLLDYPNAEDRRRFNEAKARGEINRRTGIGGLIEIHGQGGREEDWTDGCVAPDDTDMSWLYNQVRVGTMVVIVGSDGTHGPIRSALESQGGRP